MNVQFYSIHSAHHFNYFRNGNLIIPIQSIRETNRATTTLVITLKDIQGPSKDHSLQLFLLVKDHSFTIDLGEIFDTHSCLRLKLNETKNLHFLIYPASKLSFQSPNHHIPNLYLWSKRDPPPQLTRPSKSTNDYDCSFNKRQRLKGFDPMDRVVWQINRAIKHKALEMTQNPFKTRDWLKWHSGGPPPPLQHEIRPMEISVLCLYPSMLMCLGEPYLAFLCALLSAHCDWFSCTRCNTWLHGLCSTTWWWYYTYDGLKASYSYRRTSRLR